MDAWDLIIIVTVLIGVIKGWASGFLRQLVSFIGFFIGLILACLFYTTLGSCVAPYVETNISLVRALSFFLIWIGIPIVFSFISCILTKVLSSIGLGGINRLAGSFLGGCKYILFLSCLINVLLYIHVIPSDRFDDSTLCAHLSSVSAKLFDMSKETISTVSFKQ